MPAPRVVERFDVVEQLALALAVAVELIGELGLQRREKASITALA